MPRRRRRSQRCAGLDLAKADHAVVACLHARQIETQLERATHRRRGDLELPGERSCVRRGRWRRHRCRGGWHRCWGRRRRRCRCRQERRRRHDWLALAFSSNQGQHCPDRHLLADVDQYLLENAGLEDLDLDRALLGFDHGNDFAALRLDRRASSATRPACRPPCPRPSDGIGIRSSPQHLPARRDDGLRLRRGGQLEVARIGNAALRRCTRAPPARRARRRHAP